MLRRIKHTKLAILMNYLSDNNRQIKGGSKRGNVHPTHTEMSPFSFWNVCILHVSLQAKNSQLGHVAHHTFLQEGDYSTVVLKNVPLQLLFPSPTHNRHCLRLYKGMDSFVVYTKIIFLFYLSRVKGIFIPKRIGEHIPKNQSKNPPKYYFNEISVWWLHKHGGKDVNSRFFVLLFPKYRWTTVDKRFRQ